MCFLLFTLAVTIATTAQSVLISNTPAVANNSAILDVTSSQKGILIPRLSNIERDAVKNPATALLIFNSDALQFQVNTGTALKPSWQNIVSLPDTGISKSIWQINGNSNLPKSAFIGSTGESSFAIKTNNVLRVYIDSLQTKVGIGTNAPRTSLDIVATDALIVPVGTTAQRPVAPVVGMIRFNATLNKLEGYTTSGWVPLH